MSTPAAPGGVLWDTMFASRLRPTRPELLAAALAARGTDHEPLLGAPVVSEVVYGLRKGAGVDARYAALAVWWEGHILADPNRLRVVLPGVQALVVAARVLALQPTSPAKAKKKDGRKAPEGRLSWCRTSSWSLSVRRVAYRSRPATGPTSSLSPSCYTASLLGWRSSWSTPPSPETGQIAPLSAR